MIPIQDGGRELTCPGCKMDLQLPDGWVLRNEREPTEFTCRRCYSYPMQGSELSGGLCSDCVDVEAYRNSDRYRALLARRECLQAPDVLAAIDAAGGHLMKAGHSLKVIDPGPGSYPVGRWLRKWLEKRALRTSLYDIRRTHGWTGEPPNKPPRKDPRPVLAFVARTATDGAA